MTFGVEILPDQSWAARVAAQLRDRIEPGTRLCLATGDTVAPVYAWIDNLEGVTVYLLDEFGGLPYDDPGRCAAMIRRHLLENAEGGDLRVPDVDAADRAAAARTYAESIAERGIDLAVVGLGRNGHVGMNEPGSTVEMTTRVVELAPVTAGHAANYGATITPTWGITVGMAELMSAREIWVLVTGGHKRVILDRTLDDAVGPELPATFLRLHENCTVFADESAIGQG